MCADGEGGRGDRSVSSLPSLYYSLVGQPPLPPPPSLLLCSASRQRRGPAGIEYPVSVSRRINRWMDNFSFGQFSKGMCPLIGTDNRKIMNFSPVDPFRVVDSK